MEGPLIDGIRHAISSRVDLGLARLTFGVIYVVAIALGLVTATQLTGVRIPVADSGLLLSIGIDAAFSALTMVGYVFLFTVRTRLWWARVICGLFKPYAEDASYASWVEYCKRNIAWIDGRGSCGGNNPRRFGIPPTTVVLPGVVALVPGSYAFRAIVASLQIVSEAGDSSWRRTRRDGLPAVRGCNHETSRVSEDA